MQGRPGGRREGDCMKMTRWRQAAHGSLAALLGVVLSGCGPRGPGFRGPAQACGDAALDGCGADLQIEDGYYCVNIKEPVANNEVCAPAETLPAGVSWVANTQRFGETPQYTVDGEVVTLGDAVAYRGLALRPEGYTMLRVTVAQPAALPLGIAVGDGVALLPVEAGERNRGLAGAIASGAVVERASSEVVVDGVPMVMHELAIVSLEGAIGVEQTPDLRGKLDDVLLFVQRIARYGALDVERGAVLTALPLSCSLAAPVSDCLGPQGTGVLPLHVFSQLTLEGTIDVDGLGFQAAPERAAAGNVRRGAHVSAARGMDGRRAVGAAPGGAGAARSARVPAHAGAGAAGAAPADCEAAPGRATGAAGGGAPLCAPPDAPETQVASAAGGGRAATWSGLEAVPPGRSVLDVFQPRHVPLGHAPGSGGGGGGAGAVLESAPASGSRGARAGDGQRGGLGCDASGCESEAHAGADGERGGRGGGALLLRASSFEVGDTGRILARGDPGGAGGHGGDAAPGGVGGGGGAGGHGGGGGTVVLELYGAGLNRGPKMFVQIAGGQGGAGGRGGAPGGASLDTDAPARGGLNGDGLRLPEAPESAGAAMPGHGGGGGGGAAGWPGQVAVGCRGFTTC